VNAMTALSLNRRPEQDGGLLSTNRLGLFGGEGMGEVHVAHRRDCPGEAQWFKLP
jgi:hypothetical protein